MSKRLVVVGGATAVAGLVLGASVVLGPPAAQSNNNTLPNNINAPGVGSPTDDPDNIRLNIERFDYTAFELDSDGQLRGMRLRADRTNLKPQGITELINPNAEIRLGPQRAITITADRADMVMEDSKPQQGRFTGNIVVTLLQAPAGTALVLDPEVESYNTFVQQRIYLDDATDFSIEDDTLNTAGPVHVTSEQVDFYGVGLRLAYNTQRERIEQLLIEQGRYLIVNPDAPAPGFDTNDDSSAEADNDSSEANGDTPTSLAPKQFYEAVFEDDVLVRDGLTSELAGQTLEIDFTLGTDRVQLRPIEAESTGRLPSVLPVGTIAQAGSAPTIPALTIPAKNQARTLLQHVPERDIVVTWTGPLAVQPHTERPAKLTSDEDAHVTLTGPNAYAQTTRNDNIERLETSRLEYLVSKEKTTAFASDERNLRILSTALGGEITGTKLIVEQQAGTATVLGPGQLTYINEADGKTLHLTWQNRLDLELFTQSEPDAEQTKILGVKTATFDGRVTAKHTDFDLAAQTLTLAFAQPDKSRDIDNTPTSINAAGDVAVTARGDAADETFDITAGRLSIDLQLDDDREPYASAIRAIDRVSVSRPGTELTCDRVSVELNPPKQATSAEAPSASDDATASGNDDRFAEVRSILAVGRVRADLTDDDGRRVNLIADQLIADVEKDTLTLAADNVQSLAEVTDLTSGRKLTGQLIEMDDQAEQLDITGAGSLATVLEDPNNPDADIEDAFLAIDWTESMAFDNTTGVAVFVGSVRTDSKRSIDASELTCDKLTVVFSEQTPPAEANPDADAQARADAPADDALRREIRSAVAVGNVKFLASSWELGQPDQISSRLRLEGPELIITNEPANEGQAAKETLVIDGPGRMVLEDYRPPDKDDAANKATMTGRGATLFSWETAMRLSAGDNTATLVDGVQMVHLPKDDAGKTGDAVQLDCQKLVADLTDTGGMAGWLADDADDKPDAQIQTITATDNVRLLQQGTRSMRGDVLIFNAEKNLVTLDAKGNRDVVLEDLERDTATRTNKITWDLATDRIEIDQLRGGVAPLN
jgi:lipopolysaccharide export system protein LptA